MSVNFEEHFGVIIRTESYFEDNDHTNRIMVDFIDGDKRISFKGSTSDVESMLYFIQKQIYKANKLEYIP